MPTSPRRAVIGLLALACVAFGTAVLADGPKPGSAAHEIKAAGFLNAPAGAPTLAALKGKVVVLVFWATWNPPSRKSMPQLVEVQEKYASSGLQVIGLTDEEKAPVEAFVTKTKVTFPVGYGSTSIADYGVGGRPIAFVIGGDGKVAWSGYPSPIEPKFNEAIESAVAAAGK